MGGVPWTEEEDHLLKKCIEQFGEGKWHRVPLLAGLNRCRKSCRLRWLNYLRPNIRRGSFTAEEVELIIKFHKLLGNRWSLIAGRLPGRTASDVKNYWNCHLSKKLNTKQMETDTEENTDINVQIMQPQPLDLSSIVTMRPGRRVGREEASCYYPQQELPQADITTSTQFMISPTEVQDEEKKPNPTEENDIVLGDLSADFQFDDVSVDGLGSNKHRWDWDDLFMDMDLWNSSF